MAIYISKALYLSGALNDGYANANNPRVLWNDLLVNGSVTADFEEPDYPGRLVQNVSTGEWWRSSNNIDVQHLTMQISPAPVDSFAIAGHNLAGAELKLQRRDDPADPWTDVTAAVIPGDNNAIMWLFEEVQTSAYWRLYIEPAVGVAPLISVAYLGKSLQLPRRVFVGHRPVLMAREATVSTGMNERGGFLGRIVTSVVLDFALTQQNVDQTVVRVYCDPLFKHFIKKPIFVAWRPSKYPNEIAYVWSSRDAVPTNQLANGFMNFDLVGKALAPYDIEPPTEVPTA